MTTRKIAASTLWQFGSQATTMLLGILSVKFVTAALSQSLVGNYQTVYGYLQIFGILADFGLYAVAVRELSSAMTGARENSMTTFSSLFALRACITLLSLGAAVIVAWALPAFSGTPLPFGVTIAVFIPFFTLLAGVFRMVFQVEYRMRYVFTAEVVSKAIPVLLFGFALLFGARQSDSIGLYYLFLVFGASGSAILFILSIYFAISSGILPVCPGLPRITPGFAKGLPRFAKGLPRVCQRFAQVYQGVYHGFSWKEFRRLMRLSAPFGLVFLLMTIYRQSDVALIAILRPQDYDLQNAYYGVVLRIVEVGFLLPTFILNSALPIISIPQQKDADLSLLRGKILMALLILGSIVSLFSFFWARPLVLLLTNESYLGTPYQPGADTALQLLSFPIFLGMIITFCFYLLLSRHLWKQLILLTSMAAILSVLLNVSLIPRFGFVGANITSIIIHLLLAAGLSAFTLRRIAVSLRFARFAKWLAFSVIFGVLLYLSAPVLRNEVVTLVAGAVGAGVACVLLSVFGLVPVSALPWRGQGRCDG